MNEFENKIEKILTQKLKTNYSYEKMILNTLNDIKKNKKTYKIKGIFIRLATVGCAFIIITTSAVFANNIVKNFFNTNEGMDTAISNGYIIEPVMEYINSGDTEMKIDNLLMDDYNLNFTLNIRFDKAIDINNILSIELPNMIIVDNSKKILF